MKTTRFFIYVWSVLLLPLLFLFSCVGNTYYLENTYLGAETFGTVGYAGVIVFLILWLIPIIYVYLIEKYEQNNRRNIN